MSRLGDLEILPLFLASCVFQGYRPPTNFIPDNTMPNYDYRCQKCDHLFEVFQNMSADKLEDCPQERCDGKVKRLLGTGAGVIFKGSGFYQTDYRSESYQKGASKEKGASGKKETAKPKNSGGSTEKSS